MQPEEMLEAISASEYRKEAPFIDEEKEKMFSANALKFIGREDLLKR